MKKFPVLEAPVCRSKTSNVASVVNPDIIQHYHAHVYYDPVSTRDRAARLRERVAALPGCDAWAMARHTGRAAYAIDVSDCFPAATVASFLPWLMLNRDGLSILLHPGTGDAYADHIDHVVWFRMNVLRKSRKTPSQRPNQGGSRQAL